MEVILSANKIMVTDFRNTYGIIHIKERTTNDEYYDEFLNRFNEEKRTAFSQEVGKCSFTKTMQEFRRT